MTCERHDCFAPQLRRWEHKKYYSLLRVRRWHGPLLRKVHAAQEVLKARVRAQGVEPRFHLHLGH